MQPHVPDLTAEYSFYSQSTWIIDVLGICFLHAMVHIVVCITRHCQTSDRLQQELTICTVHILFQHVVQSWEQKQEGNAPGKCFRYMDAKRTCTIGGTAYTYYRIFYNGRVSNFVSFSSFRVIFVGGQVL